MEYSILCSIQCLSRYILRFCYSWPIMKRYQYHIIIDQIFQYHFQWAPSQTFGRLTRWWRMIRHWSRLTHICVSKLAVIGSENGLAPGRRQTIIWTNDGILLIGQLGTNFSEILIGIQTISFKKMHLKMSSAKWRPFCRDLNVLKQSTLYSDNASSAQSHYLNHGWVIVDWDFGNNYQWKLNKKYDNFHLRNWIWKISSWKYWRVVVSASMR